MSEMRNYSLSPYLLLLSLFFLPSLGEDPVCNCGAIFPEPEFRVPTGVHISTLKFDSDGGYTDLAVCFEGTIMDEEEPLSQLEGFPVTFSFAYNCSCSRGSWRIRMSGCDEWGVKHINDESITSFDACGGGEFGGRCKRSTAFATCGGEEDGVDVMGGMGIEDNFSDNCALECTTAVSEGSCRTARLSFPPGLKKGDTIINILSGSRCDFGCFAGPTCENCTFVLDSPPPPPP